MLEEEVIIRDSAAGDIEEITSLINELGYQTTIKEMRDRLSLIACHPDYKTIVALLNNEVVGIAGLSKGIFYELNGMYMRIVVFVVKKNSRRRGIGKRLICAAENWAIEQGLNTILINSGNRDERIEAHSFYKKMGYTIKSSGFVKKL